jgi:predicted nuclease of restriction endonuclease-like (RecB) superfamily
MTEITSYQNDFEIIRRRVYQARHKAFHSVNQELISLYWDLGKFIAEKQERDEWGNSTVERLSKDLQAEFPGVSGFSVQNLWKMKSFYLAYGNNEKLSPVVREIPWTHNCVIVSKVKTPEEREFYLQMTRKEVWSKRMLEDRIKNNEYEQRKNHQNNFPATIDRKLLSKMNWEFKDDYNLTFLNLRDEFIERDLEQGLIDNICKFLSEMGGEFCFVGRQYKVLVGGKPFFIDLLFYHRGLKSLVAVELKRGEFEPEHLGKMEFYLTALDQDVKKEYENASIGIIICKKKNKTVVEYALKNKKIPIGISTFQYKELPKNISKFLPSEEEITRRLKNE